LSFGIEPADMDEEKKVELQHTEEVLAEDVIMKSPFEEMNFRKTISVFKKATALALLAAFSAAAE
jgi:hypothetical protein